jgi:hypothetical protein
LIIGRIWTVRNINHHLWLVDIFAFLCSVACVASGRVNRVSWLLGGQVLSISSIPWIHRMPSSLTSWYLRLSLLGCMCRERTGEPCILTAWRSGSEHFKYTMDTPHAISEAKIG